MRCGSAGYRRRWIPAFAGMTGEDIVSDSERFIESAKRDTRFLR
jgi:hypothetical protein